MAEASAGAGAGVCSVINIGSCALSQFSHFIVAEVGTSEEIVAVMVNSILIVRETMACDSYLEKVSIAQYKYI